jgi:hypothetical protein
MPLDTSLTQEMAPIDVGDPNKTAQDVPNGKWAGVIEIKNRISNNSAPQLVIQASCDEALSPENEGNVGFRVTTYVTFKPATDPWAHLPKLEIKQMCDAFDVPMPDYAPLADDSLTSGERFAGFAEFIEQIEATQREFWTVQDKRDGSPRLRWSEPGKKLERAAEEEEAPPPAKAKANGHAANGKAAAGKGKAAAKPAARAQARR